MAFKICLLSLLFLIIIISSFASQAMAVAPEECKTDTIDGCNNKSKAKTLKIIAFVSILVTSTIGVCLPLITRSIPALSPDRSLFLIVKAFSAGIILGTGFMHVLPDSYEMLSSRCLPENPWHKFPFTGFVAMLSALVTLMIDSMATSLFNNKNNGDDHVVLDTKVSQRDQERASVANNGHFHGHHHGSNSETDQASQLVRYRVIAMVLEVGIVVHSVVIGLSLGASNNTCTIRGLVAALCFHQMFEGMGLGGCILQAEYSLLKKAIMVFFFSVTTPLGIAIGILLSNSYKDNSPHALITVGLLNASSAGLLIYMALVDLLAADFMGPKLQGSIKLQIRSYIAVLLGAGGMSLMATWA